MIVVKTVLPTTLSEWYTSAVYCGPFVFGGTYLVANAPENSEASYEVGHITTRPSGVFSDENDCFHHKAEGSFVIIPKWYEDEPVTGEFSRQISVSGQPQRTAQAVVMEDQDFEISYGNGLWAKAIYDSEFIDGRWYHTTYLAKSLKVSYEVVSKDDRTKNKLHLKCTVRKKFVPYASSYPALPDEISQEESVVQMTESYVSGWIDLGRVSGYDPPTRFPDYRYRFDPWNLQNSADIYFYDAVKRRIDEQCSFGDLTAEAAESIRSLSINSLAYAKDMLAIAELARGLTALFRSDHGLKNLVKYSYSEGGLKGALRVANSSNGRRVIKDLKKSASGSYLAAHYGARLTVKDTLEIADAIDKVDFDQYKQRMGAQQHLSIECPGRDTMIAVDLRMNAVIDSMNQEDLTVCQAFKRADRALYELDLAPTAENIWDMVPMSFVVDWFLPIGDAFERREMQQYVATLNVHQAFYTRKLRWAIHDKWTSDNGTTIEGNVTNYVYDRRCQDTLLEPPMRVDKPKGLSSHWVEAAAILQSR